MESGKAVALIVALTVITAVGVLVGLTTPSSKPPTSPSSAQAYTGPADPDVYPIFTSQDAISRSLALLPPTKPVITATARLVTTGTLLLEWFQVDENGWSDSSPRWLVGSLVEGLTYGETVMLPFGSGLIEDATPMAGAFWIWNANNGLLVASGALDSGTPNSSATPGVGGTGGSSGLTQFTFSDLTAIENEPLVVEHATAVPTPTDSPTSPPP